ncbi:MAG: aldolase/citrate lyase family protein [Aggregatilineales bacterium]
MFVNPLRSLWERGEVPINGWLSIPSAWTAEIIASSGYDAVTIDMQHGFMDYETAFAMLQAISNTSAVPLVRVWGNDPALIMRVLDAGALGIICPLISSRAEAAAFVGACRYPPYGFRSYGPLRAVLCYGEDYAQSANSQVITFAMIETLQGLANVEEIAATPDLDGLYIGPADLSLALGLPPSTEPSDPKFFEAVDRILAAGQASGKIVCLHARTPEYARQMLSKGFRFLTLGNDTNLLSSAARAMVKALKA